MKKMKKIFCTVLALLMLLGVCPMTVFAEEGEQAQIEIPVIPAVMQPAPATELPAATEPVLPVTTEQTPAKQAAATEQTAESVEEADAPVLPKAPEHKHNYKVANVIAATCSSKGYVYYACGCFAEFPIDPANHKYVDGKCVFCGAIKPTDGVVPEITEDSVIIDDTEEAEKEKNAEVPKLEEETDEAKSETEEVPVVGKETTTSVMSVKPNKSVELMATEKSSAPEKYVSAEESESSEETAALEKPVELSISAASASSEPVAEPLLASPSASEWSVNFKQILYSFKKGVLTLLGGDDGAELEGKDSEFSETPTDIETVFKYKDKNTNSIFSIIIENVEKIGEFAFTGLTNLEWIKIGKETEKIEQGAFAGTTDLDAIIVDPENKNYADEFGTLYSKDKTELVAVPADKDLVFPINPNVKTVDDYAFAHSNAKEIIFTGNAPEFKSANKTNKHTFEDTNASIRYPLGNWTWNPNWYKNTYNNKPFVDSKGNREDPSIRPYFPHYWRHYPVVTKAGVAPTETEFGLTEELRCRVCGKLIQAQTKIWPNGKPDTGIYSFDSINSVPASLQNNEKFNSVQKIKDVLKQETAAEYQNKTSRTMPDMNYKACDVKPITGPASGPYIVTIPYPSGVGPEHYDFVCVHLNSNGNIEKLDVFETNRGMQVTVSDLSPFGYSWYYNDVDP